MINLSRISRQENPEISNRAVTTSEVPWCHPRHNHELKRVHTQYKDEGDNPINLLNKLSH